MSFYVQEENLTSKIDQEHKKGKVISRKLASENINSSLAISLRKLNTTKNENLSGTIVTTEEKNAFDDISFLINSTQVNQYNKQEIFQQKVSAIYNKVSQNPKIYSDMISLKLEDSLIDNDSASTSHLFALAATLPLGPSSIQNTAEKIIIDFTKLNREWDEELFKNALQLYYVQSLVKNERDESTISSFIESCTDQKIKRVMMQLDAEISNISKTEEDFQ